MTYSTGNVNSTR